MTTTSIIDIIAICGFFGIVALAILLGGIWFIIYTILQHKCKHNWECILHNCITYDDEDVPSHVVKVYRCTRCGKEKRYKI